MVRKFGHAEDPKDRIHFSNAGFSTCGCRGRDSNATPSPATPSRLQMQSGKIRGQVIKLKAAIHLRRAEFQSEEWGAPQVHSFPARQAVANRKSWSLSA